MLLLANFSVVFVSPMYEANFKTVYCRMQVAVTSFFLYSVCSQSNVHFLLFTSSVFVYLTVA